MKLLTIVIAFFLLNGCINQAKSATEKKKQETSELQSTVPLKIEYSGFLFPETADCLVKNYLGKLQQCENVQDLIEVESIRSKDKILKESFFWVKTKHITDSIPDFCINKFQLPYQLNQNKNNNPYESLNELITFFTDSLNWTYNKDYTGTNLSDEESLWRYTSIKVDNNKLSLLTGIQLFNHISLLDDIDNGFYFGKNFKLWYAVKSTVIYEKQVNVLYKVIEFNDSIYITAEIDSNKSFKETTALINAKDQKNAERKHLLMELYDYLGY